MSERALFVFNWLKLDCNQLKFIRDKSEQYDELIFLIDRADEIPACSDLLVQLNMILSQQLGKPFYLLPIPGKGLPTMYHWLRWRILCPLFRSVYIDQPSHQMDMMRILRVPVEVCNNTKGTNISFEKFSKKVRGLFITRAQPFHNGHAAILHQMSQEVEEVIIVIAMANLSHSPTNFATSGERLAMFLPFLCQTIPQRFYLSTMPYSEFTLENFYELEYLLPSFDYVYTNNPNVKILSETSGYPVRTPYVNSKVSGTMIREYILNGIPYEEYVPPSVYQLLSHLKISARLETLHSKESR